MNISSLRGSRAPITQENSEEPLSSCATLSESVLDRTGKVAHGILLDGAPIPLFFSNEHLVGRSFSFLEAPDLVACAQVCHTWRVLSPQAYFKSQREQFISAFCFLQKEVMRIDATQNTGDIEQNERAHLACRSAILSFECLKQETVILPFSFRTICEVQKKIVKNIVKILRTLSEDDFLRLEEGFMYERKPHSLVHIFEIAGAYKSFELGRLSFEGERLTWMKQAVLTIAKYSLTEAMLLLPFFENEQVSISLFCEIYQTIILKKKSEVMLTLFDRSIFSRRGRSYKAIQQDWAFVLLRCIEAGFLEKARELAHFCSMADQQIIHHALVDGMEHEGQVEEAEKFLRTCASSPAHDQDWCELAQVYLLKNQLEQATGAALLISEQSLEQRASVLLDIFYACLDQELYDRAKAVVEHIPNPCTRALCLKSFAEEWLKKEKYPEAFQIASEIGLKRERDEVYTDLTEYFLFKNELDLAQQSALLHSGEVAKAFFLGRIFLMHFPMKVKKCLELFSLLEIELLPRRMRGEIRNDMRMLYQLRSFE